MLKKILVTTLFLILAVSFNSKSYAADNPGDKFTRGVVNIISAPIEIAKQIDHQWKSQTDQTKKVSIGLFGGLLKGVTYTVGRMGSGVWDIVTCPFKIPKDYGPLMKPDYVLEHEPSSGQLNQVNQVMEK